MASQLTLAPVPVLRGPVGIAATSQAAVEAVMGLLAREGVGISHVTGSPRRGSPDEGGGAVEAGRLLQAIRQLKSDADTGVIVLVSGPLDPGAAQPVLAAAGGTGMLGRPTIACLLGADPRDVGRSGAIPAARLDEAAMRAAAWVRGWDQALVSSRLQEQDERLAARAGELVARLEPGRRRLRALFDDPIFDHEARLMLAGVAAAAHRPCPELHTVTAPVVSGRGGSSHWHSALNEALADETAAVVLIALLLPPGGQPDRVAALVSSIGRPATEGSSRGPCLIVHICGLDPSQVSREEHRLETAGVFVAPGNAAAARLGAMIATRLPA